jgi:hypothetical protein
MIFVRTGEQYMPQVFFNADWLISCGVGKYVLIARKSLRPIP